MSEQKFAILRSRFVDRFTSIPKIECNQNFKMIYVMCMHLYILEHGCLKWFLKTVVVVKFLAQPSRNQVQGRAQYVKIH